MTVPRWRRLLLFEASYYCFTRWEAIVWVIKQNHIDDIDELT